MTAVLEISDIKKNFGGITAITVCGFPLTVTVRPMMAGSAA